MRTAKNALIAVSGGALVGTVMFGASGSVRWLNAWLFLGLMSVVAFLSAKAINGSPGLAEERRTAAAGSTSRDRAAVRAISAVTFLLVILAIGDHRFGWLPPVPLQVSVVALTLSLGGAVLTYRAMTCNAFFSSHVRLQSDRGHVVVTQGPYRFVRHPGYAGSIVFNLLLPLVLGSWVAVVPAVGLAALLAWRTAYEDRFLNDNLPGYGAYAAQVRHRLIPGVW